MTLHARDAGQNKIAAVHVRDASNELSACGGLRVRTASGLFSVLASLQASGPSTARGAGYSTKPVSITTNEISVSVTGGVAPYTHDWAITGSFWSVTDPTSADTSFTGVAAAGNTETTTATDTITDSAGAQVTFSVTPSVTNNAGG